MMEEMNGGDFAPRWRDDQEYEAGKLIQGTAILWEKGSTLPKFDADKISYSFLHFSEVSNRVVTPVGAAFIPFLNTIEDLQPARNHS